MLRLNTPSPSRPLRHVTMPEGFFFSIHKEKQMDNPTTACKSCRGNGKQLKEVGACPKCRGTGEMEVPPEDCKDCKGTGKFLTRTGYKVQCKTCRGTGKFKVREYLESVGRLHEFRPKPCQHCFGSGMDSISVPCTSCTGTGRLPINQLRIYLPPGIEEMIVACNSLSA